MLAGRFLMIVPALAIAGSMLGKKTVAPGPGTFPTNGALFSALLVGVVLIVGALTFFPALSLGPDRRALRGARRKDVLTWTADDRKWNRHVPTSGRDRAIRGALAAARSGDRRAPHDEHGQAGLALRPRHPQARDQRQRRQAVAAAGGEEPGDVRGRGRQRADHAAVRPRSVRRRSPRRAAVVHRRGDALAVVHGRCSRTSPRRWPRAAARRRPRRCAGCARRPARAGCTDGHGGGRDRVRAAQGRPRGRRGRRADPRRRRGGRGHRLGRRVGHHRRVGAGHPRERRRSLGGHRRHQGAVRPHRRAHHREPGRDVPRPHDRPGRGRGAPEDAERDRAAHPAGRADDRLPDRLRDAGAARALRPDPRCRRR